MGGPVLQRFVREHDLRIGTTVSAYASASVVEWSRPRRPPVFGGSADPPTRSRCDANPNVMTESLPIERSEGEHSLPNKLSIIGLKLVGP